MLFDQSRAEDVGIGDQGRNEINFWSCPGSNFKPKDPNNVTYDYNTNTVLHNGGMGSITVICPVFLPHGAIVTAAIVHIQSGENWFLKRQDVDGGNVVTLATADGGVEDGVIANATIDNSLYVYYFESTLQADEFLTGAFITYSF